MKIRIRIILFAFTFLVITIDHAFSQALINVQGVIRSKDGAPLSGATISQKRSNVVTISNQEGFFTIKVPAGAILVFSYVGYEPVEIAASEKMQVALAPQ